MKLGHINTFRTGIDKDTSVHNISNTSVVDAVNMNMADDHHIGDIAQMKGTLLRANMFGQGVFNFRVVGSIASCGNVLDCNGDLTKTRGIVFFTYDDQNKSNIIFFDPSTNITYPLFPNPSNRFKNELGFTSTTLVDAIAYEERDCCYVRFVDNENAIRKIEVKQYSEDCAVYPLVKQLSVRPLAPQDCIKFEGVEVDGALLAGGYQIAFRYYNSETCSESIFSPLTNTIPVITGDFGCVEDSTAKASWGGRIGELTNKKINLSFPSSVGKTGFDSIQLLIVQHIDGTTNAPTKGLLLNPSKDAYNNSAVSFTGTESGIIVDLSDYLVDDFPVIAAKTITNKDERDFLGNIKIQDFEFDNGDVGIDKAESIQHEVGIYSLENAYKCEDDVVNYKSYMRGEVYAYGVYIYDEFGNGVVCPLDLSNHKRTDVYIDNVSGYFVQTTGLEFVYILNVSNANHTWRAGDLVQNNAAIQANSVIGEVIKVENGVLLTIKFEAAISPVGTLDLLYGQRGNQGTSWAWKYAARCDNQYSLFDEEGQIMAMGLKLTGLKNWPSWAKGFKIVRKKRIKDVIYQIPHIPTIGVKGSYLPVEQDSVAGEIEWDYDGALNTITPKLMRMGHARNLYTPAVPEAGAISAQLPLFYARWRTQISETGEGEVSSLIFGLPPEYLYNNGEEAFDLRTLGGGQAEIVDAIAIQYQSKYAAPSKTYPGTGVPVNVIATLFSARNRENYFYNREGIVIEDGEDVFGLKIQETERFGNVLARAETEVDYQYELSKDHPPITLPTTPMEDGIYNEINTYGNILALAQEQRKHLAVAAINDGLFFTKSTNQKGILFKLKEQLEDFSRVMVQSKLVNNDDYFPFLNWNPIEEVYDEDYLLQETALGVEYPISTSSVPAGSGDVTSGAYILNIKKGLGDDRYGAIDDSGEWMETGICVPLSEMDITQNKSFDVEIYGGDVFITKHSLKINEMSPRTAVVDPIDAELPGLTLNKISRVGVHEKNIEILDVYLESSVNSSYERIVDKYPANRNNQLGSFTGSRTYLYNPGYSAENSLKVHVGKPNFCKEVNRYKSAVIWSDRHVRGAVSNALSNVEGFDRYRSNNIWFLDGKHGDVIKIDTLEDKALHIFQERKIGFQPIGVDEISTLDGALIATGTGAVIGAGDYYLQRDTGTQHMHTIQKRDGLFYGVDAERNAIFAFGSRGAGFRFLSLEKMNTHFQAFLNPGFLEYELTGHIDPVGERYFVNSRITRKAIKAMIAYNIKYQYWETQMDIPLLDSGIGDATRLYWVKDGSIYEMYKGSYNEFLGENVDSSFEVVVNVNAETTKVIQSIKLNSNFPPNSVQVRVYDEGIDTGQQLTANLNLTEARNQNEYFTNLIRTKVQGKSKKLRGRVFLLRFKINNSNRVAINSIVTLLRKSI